ncbi:uncharacterized protein LOC124260732 [Haliotis rubra]|uniref:uncharacterized protein LOC124260732 n=1 Tax=Haliotis rubra TaxID=36100 RepID=UPI001EE55CD9|nr:uncharacterized protein LOC124260732 [Haliotis rubra]
MALTCMLICFLVLLGLSLTLTMESGPSASRDEDTQTRDTNMKDQVLRRMKRARFGFRMRTPSFKPRIHIKPMAVMPPRKLTGDDSPRLRAGSDSDDARSHSHSHDSRRQNDANTDIDDANDPHNDKPMYRETRDQVDGFAAQINHPKKHVLRKTFREAMKRAYEGSASARNKLKKAAKLLLEYGPDFFDLGSSIMDMVMAAEDLQASLQPQAEPTHSTARDQYGANDSTADDNLLPLLQAMLEQHSSGSGSNFHGNGIFPGNVVVIVAVHALVYV